MVESVAITANELDISDADVSSDHCSIVFSNFSCKANGDWLSNGCWIAYACIDTNNPDICIFDIDGMQLQRVTSAGANEVN